MPIYPGDPSPSFKNYSTLQKDGVNLTKITMGSHTGTHLDAPRHFIQDGIGIDRIPPDKLIGEAYVADLSRKPIGSGITSQDLKRDLEEKIASDDIVVIYTGCSEHWGDESINRDYTYLTGEAADYLVSRMSSLSRRTLRMPAQTQSSQLPRTITRLARTGSSTISRQLPGNVNCLLSCITFQNGLISSFLQVSFSDWPSSG